MGFDIPSVLAWFLVGMLTGAIATEFLTGRGYGQRGDIGIGILGGLAAGVVASLLGLQGQPGLLLSTFAAFVGAVLLTAFARRLPRQSYVW
jgi:uncharacterized membrane protein YeaQ/YmgE (transglycosylase-associated protein family)